MALNINGTTGISGVDGSVSAPALTGTDSNTGITFPSADTIKFSTGGVERMSITNSGVSGITAGITMADSWIVTSSYDTSGTATIANNWARTTTISGTGVIGSAMTESSGVFTFPSTGIYLVSVQIYFLTAGARTYAGILHDFSTDSGSNYSQILTAYGNGYTTSAYITHQSFQVYDITNTSTNRIRFRTEVSGQVSVQGNSSQKRTGAMFIRLGDT